MSAWMWILPANHLVMLGAVELLLQEIAEETAVG